VSVAAVVMIVCVFAIAWALYELLVWLPRKRRELEALERAWREWEGPR
jgi:hypothetical protein